jgi:hypothetical protein
MGDVRVLLERSVAAEKWRGTDGADVRHQFWNQMSQMGKRLRNSDDPKLLKRRRRSQNRQLSHGCDISSVTPLPPICEIEAVGSEKL